MHLTTEAQKGQIVDLFPFIRPMFRLIPVRLNAYKKMLRKIVGVEDDLFMNLLELAKGKIAKGKNHPSMHPGYLSCVHTTKINIRTGFISDMLQEDEKNDRMTDVEIAKNAGHGFAAASDTQWGTLLGFVKVSQHKRNVCIKRI